ncbi:MAG TPA: DUF4350 domain-containing protein [Acidimicrobiales bacterium]|jgi:hypothetical protein|nr:DUF4350 domain-containing protein [Acidimicrobiales bacterium]
MRRWAPWIVLAAAVVVIALLARSGDDSGAPLDPRSTGPLGARGLVLLLEEMGAEVDIAPRFDESTDVAVLLVDALGTRQEERLQAWVEAGGVLVVADPLSDFVPALARSDGGIFEEEPSERLRPNCSLPALRSVTAIAVPSAGAFRVRDGAVACFAMGNGAYLVARSEGEGTVVALAGGAPFVNEYLDEADNAVMVVSLLAPRPGTSIVVLEPDLPGSGDEGVLGLVPRSVRSGLWQFAVAFVALALWRGRRVGAPVVESQPVDIPGSELVVATGNLMQHGGQRDAAADMLRMQLRRELAFRFGLPADAPVERVASAVAATGVDAGRIAAALERRPVRDDRELLAVAAAIESLRREVVHV